MKSRQHIIVLFLSLSLLAFVAIRTSILFHLAWVNYYVQLGVIVCLLFSASLAVGYLKIRNRKRFRWPLVLVNLAVALYILGALLKIMHWPMASEILIVSLSLGMISPILFLVLWFTQKGLPQGEES